MPVYLQSIPEGSKCKVFLMRGNTQLKGSVSSDWWTPPCPDQRASRLRRKADLSPEGGSAGPERVFCLT